MTDARPIRVWDPVVRLFHWSLVAGFMLNMFVWTDGEMLHRYIGYGILGLLGFRLIWAVVGTPYARFSSFVPTPRRLADYVGSLRKGREPRYIGHNPLGALMMIALVLLMAGCGLTGWMMQTETFWGSEAVEEIHETLAWLILALAGLHVVAALVESFRHRENLILSMLTGRKRAPEAGDVNHAPSADRR
jgi:cytochrome b